MKPRHGADYRRVKRAASEAESYQADFNHFALFSSTLHGQQRHCAKGLAPAKCHDVIKNANLGKTLVILPDHDFLSALCRFCRKRKCDHLHWTNPYSILYQLCVVRMPLRTYLASTTIPIHN